MFFGFPTPSLSAPFACTLPVQGEGVGDMRVTDT